MRSKICLLHEIYYIYNVVSKYVVVPAFVLTTHTSMTFKINIFKSQLIYAFYFQICFSLLTRAIGDSQICSSSDDVYWQTHKVLDIIISALNVTFNVYFSFVSINIFYYSIFLNHILIKIFNLFLKSVVLYIVYMP